MAKRALLAAASAAILAGSALTPVEPAQAQIPAFLPNKSAVPASEPMEIDGDWHVNTIGKVIRIEEGRAYAVEGWTHAFVLQVQPDMVTIRNIQQTSDNEYVGDDLPLMGKVTLRHVSQDRIEASVPGLLGPIRYTLTRVGEATSAEPDGPPMFVSAGEPSDPVAGGDPAPRPVQRFASLEELFGEPRPVAEAFRGCEIPENANSADIEEGLDQSPRDRITGREFAPVANDAPTADPDDECWTRIDGIWTEAAPVIFDTSLNDGREWGVQGTRLAGLLHGNYTTPETLFIVPGDDPENEIWVRSGINDLRFVRFGAEDAQSIGALIGNAGVTKTYRASERSAFGDTLSLDYTAGNELRIRLGRRQFLRPEAIDKSDLSMDDVFVIQYQTDNFAANLKGYDVLTQDTFLLMDNPKREIFAQPGREDYRIQEKYAVPNGFNLRNELLQGNVFRRTFVSSESEIQRAESTSLGAYAKISISGAANSGLALVPWDGEMSETGFSAGYSSSKSSAESIREGKNVGQFVGYARTKSFALVLDHATSKLSGAFLTAVADAQNYGNYNDLIREFGTHYPYAVTYGASAKMTQDITEESFSSQLTESEGSHVEAELAIHGSLLGGFAGVTNEDLRGSSGRVGTEDGRFIAVGGNGSWDSSGFARGERLAPILLDLRPLDELLNPINFPNQPEIYTRVRTELAQSINRYLASQARPLSEDRLIDRVSYVPPAPDEVIEQPAAEQEQEWHVYIKSIDCIKAKGDGKLGVEGDVSIRVTGGGSEVAQDRRLEASCKRRSTTRSAYHYNARTQQEGLLILRGLPSDLRNRSIRVSYDWDYVPGWRKTNSELDIQLRDHMNLAVGRHAELKKRIRKDNNPDLSLQIRVHRVR